MKEEDVSRHLYRAAAEDDDIQVLSWQGIDGKGYFAADIKFRLPDKRRLEPDVVIRLDQKLWLIEVKSKHSDALLDERKLEELQNLLGVDEVLRQVQLRSGVRHMNSGLVLAVAYYDDDLERTLPGESPHGAGCGKSVVHIDWKTIEARAATSLSTSLRALYAGQQRST